jgi:hypothetical protein
MRIDFIEDGWRFFRGSAKKKIRTQGGIVSLTFFAGYQAFLYEIEIKSLPLQGIGWDSHYFLT